MPTVTDFGRTVTLSDDADVYVVPRDNNLVNAIYGLAGDDRITGGTAGGIIYGGDGNDVLTGGTTSGEASTVLVGGLGANTYEHGIAALNGNVRDYTYYQAGTAGAFLYANNGSGDQHLLFDVGTVVFRDSTTVAAYALSQTVANAGSAGHSIQVAAVGGDVSYDGGVGSDDRLILNGNRWDYTLSRENGVSGIGSSIRQGDFVLTATNGSGRFHIGESLDTIQFQNGQSVTLRDLPATVAGNAALALGAGQDDLLFQTRVAGYQFFSGGNGSDTVYLNGNITDYTIRSMTAYSPYYSGLRVSGGHDAYTGVTLIGTNGSGQLLIDNSTETIVFKNGDRLGYGDLLTKMSADHSGNVDTLHFIPEEVQVGANGLSVSGTAGPDRLLLNGDVGDYTLSRNGHGDFVLKPHEVGLTASLPIAVEQTIETIQFQNGQYLSLKDVPAYLQGSAIFTAGTFGDDLLYAASSGDQYLTGLDGFDNAYVPGTVRDYTLKPVTVAATQDHGAINGYELVSQTGADIFVDRSTESIHFRDGQYLAFADLRAYVPEYHG